ncbi:hypothetical protein CR203_24825 [Salipaludibacillus neizhouensis]|uniref:Uncharacterized protein n=1 Tax=Salipaludibacillus neizhouensis TaxID=885475 RepID=A0A3A9K382_9BACI|nr:hypothetical protein [Salipaludibacillus neizhouensis]RKL64711.1 hypothetical protein CR203_24825 [Salipaludibacillus neizhouensis]
MKPLVKSILLGITAVILGVERESTKFTIQCSKCDCIGELEHSFLKDSGDIAVDIDDENIVSIKCNKCGSSIYSSEY